METGIWNGMEKVCSYFLFFLLLKSSPLAQKNWEPLGVGSGGVRAAASNSCPTIAPRMKKSNVFNEH